MKMRRLRNRGGKYPSAHVLFSTQWDDPEDTEPSGLLGWASEMLDSSPVCSLPQRTEKRGTTEDSKDVSGGLKPIAVFVVRGRKENRQWGNGREVYTGLCSVAIYPAQWSRSSTLAAEDKERKRSRPVLTPLFKQRIPWVRAECVRCTAIT